MLKVWRTCAYYACLFLLAGCQAGFFQPATPQSDANVTMDLNGDDEAIRTTVLHHIPQGTPVNEAKETLEQNGFKCSYLRTKDDGVYLYGELSDAGRQQVEHPFSLLLAYTPEGITDVKISSVPVGP